ncbi:MAG: tyrosine-type recombinase/integrase, partial [Thiolinea sp.]
DKLINEFQSIYLPEKNYSERTLDEKQIKLKQYRKTWGDLSTSAMTTRDIVEYLNSLTTNAYIKHRGLLDQLFQFAIHQGYRDTNPVAATMVKTAPKRTRKKHTIEGYQAIYDISPDWLQRAMDIALRSLQRRGDLTRLHRDQIDMQKGTIRILQRKTRNYPNPVYIEISMGDELRAAVQASIASGIPCPYLIHYRPQRTTQKRIYAKDHPFSVTDDTLTKKFSKYRDESGVYSHIPSGEKPTFHDLRGLGSYLYEKAGFDKNYIRALTGHASEAMLNHYIKGHEKPLPIVVSADLKFTGKRG